MSEKEQKKEIKNLEKLKWIKVTNCRKEQYYGEVDYEYNGKKFLADKNYPIWLQRLLDCVRGIFNIKFDMILLNRFEGNFSLGFHSDDEDAILPGSTVAALSFGDSCFLTFSPAMTFFEVQGGSLYAMEGCFQYHNLHKVVGNGLRYSITFRKSLFGGVCLNEWLPSIVGSDNANLEQVITPDNLAATVVELSEPFLLDKTIVDLGMGSGVFGKILREKHLKNKLIGLDKIQVQNDNYDKVIIDDVRNFRLIGDCVVISNPPFGLQEKHENIVFLNKAIEIAATIIMLHTVRSYDFVQEYCDERGYSSRILRLISFPLYKQYQHHRFPVVGLGVYVVLHQKKDEIQNQVLYSMIKKKEFSFSIPELDDYPEVEVNFSELQPCHSHHLNLVITWDQKRMDEPISYLAEKKQMKYDLLEAKTIGNSNGIVYKHRVQDKDMKKVQKKYYTFSEAVKDYLPVQRELLERDIKPPLYRTVAFVKKFKKSQTKDKLLALEKKYYEDIDNVELNRDEILYERIREYSPAVAELAGKENFVNSECIILNIKSLTQYGSSINGVQKHLEKLDMQALEFAWYAMSRFYQYELKETGRVEDGHLELVNQSSPGYPYNLVGSVKNIDVGKLIKDTLQEMDNKNENGKLLYAIYNAFTKLDLMNKRKKYTTRIISSSPAHFSLATQRFCRSFEHNLMENHRRNGIKIGIGKFYREFHSVFEYLSSMHKEMFYHEQDLSGWDHRILSFLIEVFWLWLKSHCFKDLSPEEELKFAQVVEAHVSSFFLTKEGEIVCVYGGQKSGHQTTCLSNSWMHQYIDCYTFFLFMRDIMKVFDFDIIFEKLFYNYRNAILGDDKTGGISIEYYNLGFNQEFIRSVFEDHFSLIARPSKNKFCKKTIDDDIKFLGSSFKFVDSLDGKDKIAVPLPEQTRTLDSIIYFRDRFKISAIVFEKIRDKTVVHEILRLVRVQAALINSFFDVDMRNLLLFLRQKSLEALGLDQCMIEQDFFNLKHFEKDLDKVLRHISGPQERILCMYFWIVNHIVAGTKGLSRVWSDLSIASLYLQPIKPSRFRSLSSLKNFMVKKLEILRGKKVIVMLSPLPSGKKSWLLKLLLDNMSISHDVLEDKFYIENFLLLLKKYDYVLLGEVNLDTIISFGDKYNVKVEYFERIIFPFATCYYSEIFEYIRIFGTESKSFHIFDVLLQLGLDDVGVLTSGHMSLPNNIVYTSSDQILLRQTKNLLVISYPGLDISVDWPKIFSMGYDDVYIYYYHINDPIFVLDDVYYMARGNSLYVIDVDNYEVTAKLLNWQNYTGEIVKLDYNKMTKINQSVYNFNLGKKNNFVVKKISQIQNQVLPILDFVKEMQEKSLEKYLLGNEFLDNNICSLAIRSNQLEKLCLGKLRKNKIANKYKEKYNYSYENLLHKALALQFCLIQGPPGSGKTTLIIEMVDRLVTSGESVLITAMNNRALIAISQKLDKLKMLYNWKKSTFTSQPMGVYERIKPQKIVLSTPAQLISHPIGDVDNVIVDEAGLMNLYNYAAFIDRVRIRLICVGDPQQRLPYSQEFVKDNPLSMSIFQKYDVDFQLTEIYRLPARLTGFISRNFYNSKLIAKKQTNGKFKEIIVNFVSKKKAVGTGGSVYNEETYKKYCKCDIILTPYNAQKDFLLEKGFNCETIDAYQGCEANSVLIDFTVDTPCEFVLNKHRVNVAFSRSKEELIIVWTSAVKSAFEDLYGTL